MNGRNVAKWFVLFVWMMWLGKPCECFGQDVDLFLDMSGSMEGAKAEQARVGAELLVWMLDDPFSVRITTFDDRAAQSPAYRMDSQRSQAQQWIRTAALSGGGTDYLAALNSGRNSSGRVGVFLSDGAHAGSPDDVLRFVQHRWVNQGTLHTIAIECPANSAEEKLLREMARLTGGSFTRVERSEELVKAFVAIATRLGKYRSWTPGTKTVDLELCKGRMMVFGYDGTPLVSTQQNSSQLVRNHDAVLPAEDVHASICDLKETCEVSLSLQHGQNGKGWLGGIYTNGLAVASVNVGTQNGTVPAGQAVEIEIGLNNPDGSQISQPGNVTGTVTLLNDKGQVVKTVEVERNASSPDLNAQVDVPAEGGDFTIRTETVVNTPGGHGFSAIDEQQIQAIPPIKFDVSPRLLTHNGNAVEFSTAVKIRQTSHPNSAVDFQAAMVNGSDRLRLIRSTKHDDTLTMDFVAAQPGKYSGTLSISGTSSLPVSAVSVPFDFTVKPKFAGLTLPEERDVNLGTVSAGSGDFQKSVSFGSADAETQTYRVTVTNLSSGMASIALLNPAKSMEASKDRAGSFLMQANIADCPAGTYTGRLIVSGMSNEASRDWVSNLSLTVTEPLQVDPIPVIDIPIGTIQAVTIPIRNSAKVPLQDISVELARAMSGASGETKQIVITSKSKPKGISSGGSMDFQIDAAVSPLLESTELFEGTLHVKRNGRFALSVPLRIRTVLPEKAAVPFTISPVKIQQNAEPGRPIRLELNIKALSELIRPVELQLRVDPFVLNERSVAVTEQHRFPSGSTLKPAKSLTSEVFIVAPNRRGSYQSTIVVQTTDGLRIDVPLLIDVQ